jgi:hypothetical protein
MANHGPTPVPEGGTSGARCESLRRRRGNRRHHRRGSHHRHHHPGSLPGKERSDTRRRQTMGWSDSWACCGFRRSCHHRQERSDTRCRRTMGWSDSWARRGFRRSCRRRKERSGTHCRRRRPDWSENPAVNRNLQNGSTGFRGYPRPGPHSCSAGPRERRADPGWSPLQIRRTAASCRLPRDCPVVPRIGRPLEIAETGGDSSRRPERRAARHWRPRFRGSRRSPHLRNGWLALDWGMPRPFGASDRAPRSHGRQTPRCHKSHGSHSG